MIYIISAIVITYFFIEVVLGSSVDVYNSEIGYVSHCQNAKRFSLKQFFFELIPFFALIIGLPFLLHYFYLLQYKAHDRYWYQPQNHQLHLTESHCGWKKYTSFISAVLQVQAKGRQWTARPFFLNYTLSFSDFNA
jgi:hypothetical protein